MQPRERNWAPAEKTSGSWLLKRVINQPERCFWVGLGSWGCLLEALWAKVALNLVRGCLA